LLCLQHQKRRLSEKDMMHICKSYDADIFAKFEQDGDGFYNKRMDDEAEKRRSYSLSRGNNRKKKNHMINISKSYEVHMENENENENVIINDNRIINSKKEKTTKNNTPTLDDVVNFAMSEGIGTHNAPQDFHDYYASNGWKVGGRTAMKDWKAAFRRWTRNEKTYNHDTNKPSNHKGLSSRRDADIEAIRNWGKEYEQGGGGFPDIFTSTTP